MPARSSTVLCFFAAAALAGCATLPAGERAQEAAAGGAAPKVQARAEKRIEGPAPESLIGSEEGAVIKLVGAPSLVRREKGVDVWQYTDEACTLLLFFYDKEGARRLTYLEAMPKTPGGEGVTQASCLSAQIRAFRAKDLG